MTDTRIDLTANLLETGDTFAHHGMTYTVITNTIIRGDVAYVVITFAENGKVHSINLPADEWVDLLDHEWARLYLGEPA